MGVTVIYVRCSKGPVAVIKRSSGSITVALCFPFICMPLANGPHISKLAVVHGLLNCVQQYKIQTDLEN